MNVPKRLGCERCRHRGVEYAGPAPDGRPGFRCTGCGRYWTCGYDGGELGEWMRTQGVDVCKKLAAEQGGGEEPEPFDEATGPMGQTRRADA